eukprot:COSAG01_NODE_1641_length_9647_cov_5.299539_19_plen_85_part_00
MLTGLDSCLQDPATLLDEPARKGVAADLYYFRALVLARSGRMEAVRRPFCCVLFRLRFGRCGGRCVLFGLRFTYVASVLSRTED